MAIWSRWLDGEIRVKPDGLLLAAAYAVGYVVLRDFSHDQWYLPAGWRVAALLLMPYRYWPYLIAGEYAAFAWLRIPLIEKHGLTWVIAASVLLMPTVAGLVYAHRKRRMLAHPAGFLSLAALAATVATSLNMATIRLQAGSTPDPVSWSEAVRYAIGDYLGILILAPLVLLWRHRKDFVATARRLRWDAALASTLIAGLAVAVEFQAPYSFAANGLQVLMILPAAVLTCLHGWRGAAIGVIAVNLAIGLTLQVVDKQSHDEHAFVVQQLLAVAGTVLLAFGAVISRLYHAFQHHDTTALQSRAQAIVHAGLRRNEAQLRTYADRIKHVGEDIEAAFEQSAQWLERCGYSTSATALRRAGAVQAQRLRDEFSLMYPLAIEQCGLYTTLMSSVIATTWEQTHRVSTPRLSGDPCRLSRDLQVAAFRCIVEAVAVLLESETGTLVVRARCGRYGSCRGIVVEAGLLDPQRALSPQTALRVQAALGVHTLAYGGIVRCRRNRLHLLLRESVETALAYGASDTLTVSTR